MCLAVFILPNPPYTINVETKRKRIVETRVHVGFNIVNVGKEGIYLNNRRPKLEDTGEAGDCNRLGTYCDFLHGTLHDLWPKQQSKAYMMHCPG